VAKLNKYKQMKLLKNIFCTLTIAAVIFLADACRKPYAYIQEVDTDISSTKATVQVFGACARATRNYMYVDGVQASGSAFAFGGVFPGAAYSITLNPGTHSILIKDTTTITPQLPLTFSQNFDAGKFYTVFTYDTITSPKALVVQNNITIPRDTSCMLRFANFIYNPTPVGNVDVYAFRNVPGTPVFVAGVIQLNSSTALFSNIATNTVTDFIPFGSLRTDTLYVVATGTKAPILAKQLVQSLTPTRSYTSAYIGSFRSLPTAKSVTTFSTY
jgi:Domain of unknown function (DUF4397)